MSTTSTANDIARPPRRSTRVTHAVPLTVMGVDSYRGPYREDVSTVTISAHGCKYESKHDVLTNSWVMLELNDPKNDQPVSARGLVKWVKRPLDTSAPFETAIELEDPGNIWGIDSPPEDWMKFCESRLEPSATPSSKPFAVPKPEPSVSAPSAAKRSNGGGSLETHPKPATPDTAERPVGHLIGELNRQMEKIIVEAAGAAVRDRASSTLDEIRKGLREEARKILAEVTTSQTAPWIEQSLKQMKQASQDSARTFHSAWTKRLEADVKRGIDRIGERTREFEMLAESLSANALERLQRGLEASRGDGVDRIVSRLKEQSATVMDRAKETIAELTARREELEGSLDQLLEKSSARIDEMCVRSEAQLEMIVRERLGAAREELDRAIQLVANRSLSDFKISAERQETEQQARLRDALQPICDAALNDLAEKAAQTSRQFASEMSSYSRSHLEFLGSTISEAAKGMGGKLPKE